MDTKRLSQIHSQGCLTPEPRSALPHWATCCLFPPPQACITLHAKKKKKNADLFQASSTITSSPLGHRIPSAAAGALASQEAQGGGQ